MAGPVITVSITSDSKGVKKGTQEAEGHFKSLSKSVSGFMVGIGAAVGLMAVDVAKQVGGLVSGIAEDLMGTGNQLENQLGLTSEQAGKYADIGAGIFKQAWGDSISDVSLAAAGVAKQLDLVNDADIEDITTKAFALADTFGIDVNDAIFTASQLLEHDLVDSAAGAMDLLTVGLQKMPAAVRDELLEATNEYGTFFSDLGFTGAETFALLTDAANEYGVYGIDKTGDALKEFGLRATDMSELTGSAYESIGLDAREMEKRLLEGGETSFWAFQQIVGGLQTIKDPAEQASAAIALFGTPLEDLGVQNIPDFLDSLTNIPEGFENVNEAAHSLVSNSDTLRNQLESLKRRALVGLADFIVTRVIPVIEQLVASFKENWPQIKAAVVPVIEAIISTVQELAAWFQDDFLPVAKQVGQQLIEAFNTAVDWFTNTLVPRVRKTFNTIVDFFNKKLLPPIKTVVNFITKEFSNLVTWFRTNGSNWITTFKATWDSIVAVVRVAIAVVAGIIYVVIKALQKAWEMWGEDIVSFLAETWQNIKDLLEGVLEVIRGVIQTVMSLIRGDWEGAWEGIKAILDGVWQVIIALLDQAWELIKLSLKAGLEVIKSLWGLAWDWVKERVSNAWKSIKSTVSNQVDAIVGFVKGIPGRITGTVSTMWNGIKTGITVAKNWVGDRITDIVSFVIGMPERYKNIIANAFNGLKTAISEAKDWVRDRITEVVNLLINLPGRMPSFGGMFDGIKNAFRSALNWVIDKWNALEFNIPGIMGFGGATIGTPNIPRLADGGIVKAKPGGTLALIGEGGHDEAVVPLKGGMGLGGGNTYITINMPAGSRPQDVFRAVEEHRRRGGGF